MQQAPRSISIEISKAVEQAKNGDLVAQEALYVLYRSRVYSLCLRSTDNAFDADDLTQDIFIQVFRKLSTFRGEAQFTTWLYKVARNYAYMHARRRRRNAQLIVDDLPEATAYSVSSRSCSPSERLALIRALSGLTSARRIAVWLYDIQGLTHEEIARRLGITVIASKTRLHRAHIVLRNILSACGNGRVYNSLGRKQH